MAEKKILIIEDEPQMQKVLEKKLSGLGYSTDLANDGVTALEKIRKGGVDLILLDMILPSKNGFDILEEVGSRNIDVPIIVLSNLGEDEDIETATRLGAREYLVKSNISLRDIVAKIEEYL